MFVIPRAADRRVLKVAHYGTGSTGRHALRAILRRSDLELVAQLVHSPAKVGLDAGEIAGVEPVGVRASADFDALLASDADCVMYCATNGGRAPEAVFGEMARILATGKNLVATTYAQLVYPWTLPEPHLGRLRQACETGGSSLFVTGISPGLATDVLSVLASSVCDRIRTITAMERFLSRTYPYGFGVFQAMGFGLTAEEHVARCTAEPFRHSLGASISMVADAIGLRLDEIRAERDFALAPAEIVAAGGTVAKGCVGSIRVRVMGMAGGEPVLTFGRISSLTDDPVDDWEPQTLPGIETRRMTQIRIDAEPKVHLNLGLAGSDMPGEEATAFRAVNAIRPVCEASPGVKSPLDLPLFGGAIA